jgi:hypothetical protein
MSRDSRGFSVFAASDGGGKTPDTPRSVDLEPNSLLTSKRGLRLQQPHPIFLTVNVSNKSGHLLFAQS